MPALTIEIPEDVLVASGQSREEFIREAKFLLAAKLFELGRLVWGLSVEMSFHLPLQTTGPSFARRQ